MPAGLFSRNSSNSTATVPISCKFVITSSWGSRAAAVDGESYAKSNFDHHVILNADLVCLILVRGTVGCCCAVWNSVLRRCCLRVAVSHQLRRDFHLHFRCRSGEHYLAPQKEFRFQEFCKIVGNISKIGAIKF